MSPASFPWESVPVKNLPFVALDFETTGFDPASEEIVELAFVPLQGSEDLFQTLVDPGIPIPPEVSKVHGITDAEVRGQPKLAEVMGSIQFLLNDAIFVSHNVPFDWGFLHQAFVRHLKMPLQMPNLCTLELSRRFLNIPRNNLEAVAQHLKVPLSKAHRAGADTLAVKGILSWFLDYFDRKGMKTGGDLLRAGLIKLVPPAPPPRFNRR